MSNDIRIVAALFLEQAKALWPYYLGGIVFAAVIKTLMWDRRIRASLVHHEKASILVAVVAGLISPLCYCGILPVVIALSASGVSLPPVLALLITSPMMSPDAFLITVGQLGWTYALWKLGAAAVVGVATGFTALALARRGILPGTSFKVEKMYAEAGAVRPGFEEIVKAGCFAHAGDPGGIVDRGNRFLFFLERLRDMGLLVGKYLLAALFLQSVITYYVPANVVEPLLGRKSALSVLFATLISIPLPLTQVMAPSVIKGLLSSGMSPGAAMAMLVGGPVTSLPAIYALLGVYDRRAFALYLGFGVTAAVVAGTLFQSFYG